MVSASVPSRSKTAIGGRCVDITDSLSAEGSPRTRVYAALIRTTLRIKMPLFRYGLTRLGSSAALWTCLAVPVLAAPYDFVPAPQTDLNRIYRVDRVTGEITSCQYGLQEGTIGATLCFGSGEGAGPQTPGGPPNGSRTACASAWAPARRRRISWPNSAGWWRRACGSSAFRPPRR